MAWKTQKIVEVWVGIEINMYACARTTSNLTRAAFTLTLSLRSTLGIAHSLKKGRERAGVSTP